MKYKRQQCPRSLFSVHLVDLPSLLNMSVSRFFSVTALAALLSFAQSQNDTGTIFDPDSICYSYGVDFVDEGHYFINSQSTEQFSAVSTFKGCNSGEADILLVDPNDIEYLCDDIPTTPDDTKQLSNCPIQKDQMSSGHWLLLILGNNGDYPAQPFAWQRGMYYPTTQLCPIQRRQISTSLLAHK